MSDKLFVKVNNFRTYASSFHPAGPKVEYICGNRKCLALDAQRVRHMPLRYGRKLAFHCRYCGQKNYLPLVATYGY